jgi:hypothetical protein
MLIHAYLTDGFFQWAKFFLETFKFHNGTGHPIIFTTKNLTEPHINELKNVYSNIEVDNKNFDMDLFCKRSGLDKGTLLRYKREVEFIHVTPENRVWKLMVAGDDRIKSIYNIVKDKFIGESHVLHFDIDMYIRAPLIDLFEFVERHDISIKLRLASKINRKTMIGLQGYKFNSSSVDFLERWIRHIDAVKPSDRHLGYGQTSCYYAYEEVKDKYNWGDIPSKFISPYMRKEDLVWSANTLDGKTKNLKLCRGDFKNAKKSSSNRG